MDIFPVDSGHLHLELILVSCGEVMMKPDAVSIENKLNITAYAAFAALRWRGGRHLYV